MKPIRAVTALALVLAPAAAGRVSAQAPGNLGFEETSATLSTHPARWLVSTRGSGVLLDSVAPHAGKYGLKVFAPGAAASSVYARATQALVPVAAACGKRVRVSGWIRTENVAGGRAALWVRVGGTDPRGPALAFDGMAGRGPTGTTPWTRYQVEARVDSAAASINFGVLLEGGGSAWFDDLEIEIDGVPYDPAAHLWAPSDAEVAWARAHALPLAADAPGAPTGDLEALRPLLAGARVVALGESTHGTREIFTTKDRLIRWMVEHGGATAVAFEASMPESRRINEYVLTGRGDPRAALAGVVWTWNTEEVLALVEWMRAYNASGRGRVEFWGFDLQSPTGAADSVRAFVARADPAFLPAVDSAYAVVSAALAEMRATGQGAPARVRAWGEAAARVSAHLARRRADYLARFDTLEVDWAEQSARIVEQGAAARLPGGVRRDSSMALNLAWIAARQPAAGRVVAWAHNSHAERSPGSMGGSLDRRFGDAYRVIGFAFGEGEYTARGPRGLTAYPAPAAPAGTVESALRRVGLPRFVLDLRAARADNGGAWLLEPHPFRAVGDMATDDQFRETPVASRFDALIYLDRTTASRLLPGAGR